MYHGDIGVFCIGDTFVGTDFRDDFSAHISDLADKRINILDLKICQSGTLSAVNIYPESYIPGTQDYNYGYNIALQFLLSFSGINSVRAWNGTYQVANNIFGHYERGIISSTEYEECCYIYSRCDEGFLIVQDNDIEITGLYNFYTIPLPR